MRKRQTKAEIHKERDLSLKDIKDFFSKFGHLTDAEPVNTDEPLLMFLEGRLKSDMPKMSAFEMLHFIAISQAMQQEVALIPVLKKFEEQISNGHGKKDAEMSIEQAHTMMKAHSNMCMFVIMTYWAGRKCNLFREGRLLNTTRSIYDDFIESMKE